MNHKRNLLSAACGLALLAAAPAAASTLDPVASLSTVGNLSFNAQTGLTLSGDFTAEYRQPPGAAVPYIFGKKVELGPLTYTPNINLVTPRVQLTQDQEVCLPFIGCNTIPGLAIPSFGLDLVPPIELAGTTTVFDGAVTSPELPVGAIFGFDFGSPLIGSPLTFGNLVQNQFETGATTVSTSGGLGPFDGSFTYNGTLLPGNEVIEATYLLEITDSGLLGGVETFITDLFNDNAAQFQQTAFDLFLALDPCTADFLPIEVPGAFVGTCRNIIGGLDPALFTLELASLGTLTGEFHKSKTITPVPVPAALPLLAGGIAVFGLMGLRRRKMAA